MTLRMMTRSLAAALGLAFAQPAVADRETVDGIEYNYTVSEDGASVTLKAFPSYNLPETLILPETLGGKPVTVIEERTFAFQPIVSLTLPASLTNVNARTFFAANALQEVKVAAGNKHFTSKDGVLFKQDVEKGPRLVVYPSARKGAAYDIPEGTTRLDVQSFNGCLNLERITIPASLAVSGFEKVQFIVDCPNLVRVDVAEGNVNFHDEDGVLFLDAQRNPLQSRLLVYPAARTETVYTIPDHVIEVCDSAFAYSKSLEKVTFPASVTRLKNLMLDRSTNLKALYFNGEPPEADDQAFLNTPGTLKVYYTDATYQSNWEAVYADGGKWKDLQDPKPPVAFGNADGLPRDGETSWTTGTRSVAVPNAWLLDNVPGLTEDSTAAEAAAALEATGANGISRGLSYLFGFAPDSATPAAAQLKVSFDGFDAQGLPKISWSPDQRTNESVKACVKYTIRAATTLDTKRPWSDYVNLPLSVDLKKFYRFFYVEVEAK